MKMVRDFFGVTRFTCSFCSAPSDVLAAVNDALVKGESGRKIAARSAFSKSALYRHRDKCLPREVIRRHRDKMAIAAQPGKGIVSYGKDEPREQLGPNDRIIRVEFQVLPLDAYKNPRALISSCFDKTVAEHLRLYPKRAACHRRRAAYRRGR